MVKLQLALDDDLAAAFAMLSQVHHYVDIVEIGTPLILHEGMHGVRKIREAYPDLMLLADLKIMDAGEKEADIAFSAGANIVTVLGVTNQATIQGAITSARKHKGQVMVDMMCVENPLERSKQYLAMGCDVLCVHTASDVQSTQESPYHELETLRQNFPLAHLAIAGGVNFDRLEAILPYKPDIIIVGSAITRADDPTQAAQLISDRVQTDGN